MTRPFSRLHLNRIAIVDGHAVSILPAQQLAALNEVYRKAVARKRLRVTLAPRYSSPRW